MKFTFPVNEAVDGGTVTYKVVDCGDVSLKVAKRKLRIVLKEWGVPANQMKKLINETRPI